jgi:deazaflavin-dependent oxidoreductase (nitroreductase family)
MNLLFQGILGILTSLYRLSNGKVMGRMAGLNILLLTTIGRKSAKKRTTPLGYFEHEGNYVIIASNGGADKHPAWFLNLKSNPNVNIEIKDKKIDAEAKEAEPNTRAELWAKLVSLSPLYGKYATSTKRVIPIVLLQPRGL